MSYSYHMQTLYFLFVCLPVGHGLDGKKVGGMTMDCLNMRKIWFSDDALVCMSLLDFFIEIKITVSIGFSFINHWFPNTFHFLVRNYPLFSVFGVKPVSFYTFMNLENPYNTIINSIKRGEVWTSFQVWLFGVIWLTFPGTVGRAYIQLPPKHRWQSLTVESFPFSAGWHPKLLGDHVPICCICFIPRLWNRYVLPRKLASIYIDCKNGEKALHFFEVTWLNLWDTPGLVLLGSD